MEGHGVEGRTPARSAPTCSSRCSARGLADSKTREHPPARLRCLWDANVYARDNFYRRFFKTRLEFCVEVWTAVLQSAGVLQHVSGPDGWELRRGLPAAVPPGQKLPLSTRLLKLALECHLRDDVYQIIITTLLCCRTPNWSSAAAVEEAGQACSGRS